MAIIVTIDQVEALYIGYFGRAGEPDGVNYWVGQLNQGYSFAEMAASFAVQAETLAQYPYLSNPELNPSDFITSVYQNLFGRGPDPEGLSYWADQLNDRAGDPAAVGQFILDVLSGAYGSGGSPTDVATIENKIEAASYYTHELEQAGIGGTHIDANGHGVLDSDLVDSSNAAIGGVTSDPATVDASKAATDAFVPDGGPASEGGTFTLTTGDDSADQAGSVLNGGNTPSDFHFTGGNETVVASNETLQASDTLSDDSTTDHDVLNLALSGATEPGAASITNIETIHVMVGSHQCSWISHAESGGVSVCVS
jgi:hypothetical protein